MRSFLFALAGLSLLVAPVQAQDVVIGGLVDVGFTHSLNDPATGAATGVGYAGVNNNEDTFNVNLAQISVSKEADPVGFSLKLDFLNTADDGVIDGGGDDIAVQNAQIDWKTDVGSGLTVSAGKLETLVGFDVIESASNPHSSHGLLFALVPYTHTGVRVAYPLMDNLNLKLGLNNGNDIEQDNNSGKSIEAQLGYTPTESWFASLTINWGPEGATVAGANSAANKTFLLNFVTTYDFTEELSAYLELTYAAVDNGDANGANPADLDTLGIGVGATYWFTDIYGASARFEYIDSDANAANAGGTAIADAQAWDITLTGHAKITDDLTLRIEYRHDDSDAAAFADDSTDVGSPAADDSSDTIGIQLLYSF
jgi:hypothetical protein